MNGFRIQIINRQAIIDGVHTSIFGTDHIARAFEALGRADTVLGPAEDGGYWLVGMKRFPRVTEIFEDVRWSSEHTLADTKANIERAGLTLALADTLNDVDTGADYRRWKAAERRKCK